MTDRTRERSLDSRAWRRASVALGAIVTAALCIGALAGCLGTETGNPSVALRARSSDPAVVGVGGDLEGLRVEEAWISVTELRRLEGEACDHVATQAELTDVAAELVEGRDVAEFPQPGECGIRVSFGGATTPPPTAPAALADHALVVSGVRADGAPFEILSRFPHNLELRATDARLGAQHASLVWSVDVAPWFSGLGLDSVPTDADGVARLGATDALTLELERRVPGSLGLFIDGDGDGRLDADELAAGPVAATR